MAYQMRVARFQSHRDLAGFDFTQAHVDEALVQELHQMKFLESAHNVVFVGGPGTGKRDITQSTSNVSKGPLTQRKPGKLRKPHAILLGNTNWRDQSRPNQNDDSP